MSVQVVGSKPRRKVICVAPDGGQHCVELGSSWWCPKVTHFAWQWDALQLRQLVGENGQGLVLKGHPATIVVQLPRMNGCWIQEDHLLVVGIVDQLHAVPHDRRDGNPARHPILVQRPREGGEGECVQTVQAWGVDPSHIEHESNGAVLGPSEPSAHWIGSTSLIRLAKNGGTPCNLTVILIRGIVWTRGAAAWILFSNWPNVDTPIIDTKVRSVDQAK